MDTSETSKNKRSIGFRLLYYWTKFLGINPLSLTTTGAFTFTYIGLLYGFVLSAIYFFIFVLILNHRSHLFFIGETPASLVADCVAISGHFFESLSTLVICSVFQNHTILIIHGFVRTEKISLELGALGHHEKYFGKIARNLAIVNVVYVVSLTSSHELWKYFGAYDMVLAHTSYLTSLTSFNTIVILLWSLVFIKRKFHFINVKVESFMRKSSIIHRPRSARTSSYDFKSLSEKISAISKLHRELRDLVSLIEEQFSFPILFNIGNNSAYITSIIYDFYQNLKSLDDTKLAFNCLYVLASSHWIVYPFIILFAISNICGSTVDEANNTRVLLHKMINDRDVHDERRLNLRISILSLDLLQNQLRMSVYGLFNLDHFLIYNVMGTIATYLTIMLQFYN